MPRILSQPGIYRKESKKQWWSRSRGLPSSCSSASSSSSIDSSSAALNGRSKTMEGMSYRLEESDNAAPAKRDALGDEWGYFVDFQSPYNEDNMRKTFGKFSTVDEQRE